MTRLGSLLNTLLMVTVRRSVLLELGKDTKVNARALLRSRGGKIVIGDASIVSARIKFDGDGVVSIGKRCFVGASHLVCRKAITLEDDVVISWNVTIVDHDSHALDWNKRRFDVTDWAAGRKDWTGVNVAPVIVKRRAWIGFGSSILKGVTIGEGAIVGACSVVTRDVPDYTVVAGNPARAIRTLEPASGVEAEA